MQAVLCLFLKQSGQAIDDDAAPNHAAQVIAGVLVTNFVAKEGHRVVDHHQGIGHKVEVRWLFAIDQYDNN